MAEKKTTVGIGATVPRSGQYYLAGPRGGRIGKDEINLTKGNTAPPNKHGATNYVLADPTKNGAGKGK